MPNEIRARLHLTGFLESPEEITDRLGIQPTEVWRIGDPIDKTIRRFPENGWSISSGVDSSAELSVHIVHLLEGVRPAKELIRSLGCKVELSVGATPV